jgi:hypothetical protein
MEIGLACVGRLWVRVEKRRCCCGQVEAVEVVVADWCEWVRERKRLSVGKHTGCEGTDLEPATPVSARDQRTSKNEALIRSMQASAARNSLFCIHMLLLQIHSPVTRPAAYKFWPPPSHRHPRFSFFLTEHSNLIANREHQSAHFHQAYTLPL